MIAGVVIVAGLFLWLVWLGSQVQVRLGLTPDQRRSFAVEEACRRTDWAGCKEAITQATERWPRSFVAICEHPDGTGDVVRLEREASWAETACTADGAVPGSRVVTVIRLPQ